MSSSSSNGSKKENITEILAPTEIVSSGDDPPMSEWSSLIIEIPEVNKKRAAFAKGVYKPGSGEICAKYIPMSDSAIFRHHYFNYPAVLDPGIESALRNPEQPLIYPDDGQALYKALCAEMDTCLVRLFYEGLLKDEINLSYYCVNPYAVRPMAAALQYNKTVCTLNLTDNFLNDDACFHLAQMLTSNTTLRTLILAGCRIGPSGILRLGSELSVNRSLEELDLSRNCLAEEGGVLFAKQIEEGAGIPRINLSNNQLGRLAATALAEAFEYKNTVTHLDLSWNNFFHGPSAVKMLEQLAYSEMLQELNLAWNALEGDKIANVIKLVLLVPTLKTLNLSNNRLQNTAISIISQGLLKAKKLSSLNLSFNPLSTNDAYIVLQKMLKPRVKIQKLLLEGIAVDKNFPELLQEVMAMKTRKNFSIIYGTVLSNWTLKGPDSRKVILERANYLGTKDKKRRVDIGVYFLGLGKEFTQPILVKTLMDQIRTDGVPLDEDCIVELTLLFPGPKIAGNRSVDVLAICDYINRLWPEKKPPPTPPPEPEPEPQPTKQKKGKKK